MVVYTNRGRYLQVIHGRYGSIHHQWYILEELDTGNWCILLSMVDTGRTG